MVECRFSRVQYRLTPDAACSFNSPSGKGGSEATGKLCKKAAYTVEIFCWQNVRDVIAEEIRPLTDKHIEKLLAATKILPDVDLEPKLTQTLNDVVSQYDDLLARKQRSGLTYANLTREESLLQDQIEDFQGEELDVMKRYPTLEGRKTRLGRVGQGNWCYTGST